MPRMWLIDPPHLHNSAIAMNHLVRDHRPMTLESVNIPMIHAIAAPNEMKLGGDKRSWYDTS